MFASFSVIENDKAALLALQENLEPYKRDLSTVGSKYLWTPDKANNSALL